MLFYITIQLIATQRNFHIAFWYKQSDRTSVRTKCTFESRNTGIQISPLNVNKMGHGTLGIISYHIPCFCVVLLFKLPVQECSNVTIKVGILLLTKSEFPVDIQRVGPAIDKGIEDVQTKYGITLKPYVSNYDGWCTDARYTAPGNMAKLYYQQNVQAFIGPACSYAVETAGRLSEYLRVPMVTGLGDLVFRKPAERDMFRTTVILSYNVRKLSRK